MDGAEYEYPAYTKSVAVCDLADQGVVFSSYTRICYALDFGVFDVVFE